MKVLRGFTMIELLVVLLIIGILAAVAAPMYLRHTERAKASEAVAVMSLMRQAEREYFSKHKTYLAVSSPDLPNDPEAASNQGLDITVGPSQYFSFDSYSVATGNQSFSGGFGNTTQQAEDFLITTTGSASVTAAGKAHNAADVASYLLEMDNGGTIVYSTDNGTTYKLY